MSLLDQFRHETIDKSQHQRSDMRPVHIGIRHNNDLVVPQLADIKIIMNPRAESRDHGFDLSIGINFIQSRLFHIQDFTAKRQNSLRRTASGSLGRTACRISLHDIDLAILRIFIGTVRQLTRKSAPFQRRLTPCQIPRLSGRLSGTLRQNRLLADRLGNRRILLQEIGELFTDHTVNRSSGFRIPQLLFRLSFKLRIFHLYTDNSRQTFPDILSGKIRFTVFQQFISACIIVKSLRQRIPETYQMRTALRCINIIDKSIYAFVIGIIMLQGHLNIHAVPAALEIHNVVVQCFLTLIQICNKLLDTALVMEFFLLFLPFSFINKNNS